MCVLRLLDKTRAFFTLSELGMPDDTYASYRDLIRSPYGMVMCAGPTGSGKTTTLYATLAADQRRRDQGRRRSRTRSSTSFPSINQIQINEQAGVTFATGLRAILRQDPDSILVGEIRDVETARIAVQAALTGHFVMSSLHATDASVGAAPLPRHGHRAVPARVVAARRRRPAARAPQLPALRRVVHADASRRSRSSSAAAARPKTPSSCTARAATSAATPATSNASASTRCCASPTRSAN